jgi:RNA polymerase sigma-B factor
MTAATATVRHTQAASLPTDESGRWQPRPGAVAMTSTPDLHVPGGGRAYPDALLARLHGLPPDDAGRAAARVHVIDWYLPMSESVARRFAGRGEPLADLTQVAAIGLIKAVDRYDVTRGVPFAGYAIPTIAGEIKRYFRYAGWTVRVPRWLQELGPQLAAAVEELAQVLHRSPTTAELAARLDVSRGDVLEARRSASAYRPLSFEQPVPGSDDLWLIDALSGPDPGIDAVDRRETLRRGLAALPVRSRRIIALRFVGDLTQAQIAARLGMSQMHVSRLLAHALTWLRDAMHDDVEGVPPRAGRAKAVHRVTRADTVGSR